MRFKPKKEHLLPNIVLDEFCQDVGNYLRRGHTLSECFAAMAARSTSSAEEQLYLSLRTGVRTGSLSDAMKKTTVFPEYMVELIENAEKTDTLAQTVEYLSCYFERERAANESLHGRTIYPAVMSALTCFILIVTAGFVLPILADQFSSLGLSFSPFARWAMNAGRWFAGLAGMLLTAIVFAGVLLWILAKNSGWKLFQNTLFARKLAVGRFAAALALFRQCGLSDKNVVLNSASLNEHPDIESAKNSMLLDIDNGLSLTKALANTGLISGSALGRLNTDGQEAFLLDEVASKLAKDSAGRMDRLLVILEPIIVLILSGASGLLLLSVMLPLLGGLASMA